MHAARVVVRSLSEMRVNANPVDIKSGQNHIPLSALAFGDALDNALDLRSQSIPVDVRLPMVGNAAFDCAVLRACVPALHRRWAVQRSRHATVVSSHIGRGQRLSVASILVAGLAVAGLRRHVGGVSR